MLKTLLLCIVSVTIHIQCVPLDQKCEVPEEQRFDCFPDEGANEEKCEQRGCCWHPAADNEGVGVPLDIPYCFYGRGVFGYNVCGEKTTDFGFSVDLCMFGSGGPYGGNVEKLKVDIYLETVDRVRVKIYDPANERYEVPVPTAKFKSQPKTTDYEVSYIKQPFGFTITRKSTKTSIFNTVLPTSGFIFSDQYIQISSTLPSNNIYGLGEHVIGLKLNTSWTRLTMFSRDITDPVGGGNLYGTHPFYVNIEDDGNANAVFFKNSNAMDIILQPVPAITYRSIGGILDFYVFLGPTPDNVVTQLTDLVGRPTMPPYWSLGFHLCRYGYNSIDNMKMVRARMDAKQIPQDTQWNDIDYMDSYRDFTIDPKNFAGLSEYADELHAKGMHYILMADPAISSTDPNYKPYKDGVAADAFIKDHDGNYLQGVVWPGNTVFPDFFNPNTTSYWYQQIAEFHDTIKFDGLWIDMNEPSNFVTGSLNGCPQNNIEHPPFVPGIFGGVLADKTICMTAKQYNGIHYDLHSLYGHSESVATMAALKKVLGKRSVVITRSSYTGTGPHAGHWLGDNTSTWVYLYKSIAGILNFNLFGIPFVGADICGFLGDTNDELCQRWMQLGAFYPFMRNHNNKGQKDQDPAVNDVIAATSRAALRDRYFLLPYLYTLHFDSFLNGTPVARPLFFSFPKDKNTYSIDTQFLWGDGLMISPVVQQGAQNVNAYVPAGRWYEFYTGAIVDSKGQFVTLPAAFDKINLHVHGGVIIPTQEPAMTTTKSRELPFGLIVALDGNGEASGNMYLDDGEQLLDNGIEDTTYIHFQAAENKLRNIIIRSGYKPTNSKLNDIQVWGVISQPTTVTVDGNSVDFKYDGDLKVLRFNAGMNLLKETNIAWS